MRRFSGSFFAVLFVILMPAVVFGQCRQRTTQSAYPDPVPSGSVSVHVIYALAKDSADRHLDTNCAITHEVSSIQNYVAAQNSGGQIWFRTVHYATDITYVQLSGTRTQYANYDSATALQMTKRIEAEINLLGLCGKREACLVYYEGTDSFECGDVASPDTMGNTAVLILHGTPPGTIPCDANPFATSGSSPLTYWGASALHEIFHVLKFVQDGAPNSCGAGTGHITDPNDIMFGCGGQWGNPAKLHMDIIHVNYFLSGRPYDLSRSAIWQPLPPNPELPSGWPYGTLASQGTETANLKSSSQGPFIPTQIWLINGGYGPIGIYWMNYDGNPVLYKTIDPKDEFTANTFVNQPWVAKSATGRVLAVYFPTPAFGRAIVR